MGAAGEMPTAYDQVDPRTGRPIPPDCVVGQDRPLELSAGEAA